jgi:cytochrome c biogenesis protein CcmG, thiol:disulfide interchange protein DsbE
VEGSSNRVRTAALAVGVVVVSLITLLAVSGGGDFDDVEANRLLGKKVPVLVGPTLDGANYDIDNARGRWVLVNFFATWCAPCRAEHPELVALEAWGAETGQLELLSIVFDDDPQNVSDLFAELGGSWPVMDAPATVVDFQLRRVPESLLVNPDGVVVAQFISGVRADQIIAEIG